MTLNFAKIKFIIWKKIDGDYSHFISNGKIPVDKRLHKYLEGIDLAESFKKLLESHVNQYKVHEDCKIILEYLNEDFILELHLPFDDNLYILSTISHKIRNPLTNIVGVLSLLDENKMTKSFAKHVNLIRRSSYDIVEVANDIIDIINLSRDEIKLHRDRTDLSKLLNECHTIMMRDFNLKNISVKISMDKDLPSFIIVDSQRLKQIIINLLNNAVSNTQIGTVILEVKKNNKKEDLKNPFPFIETESPFCNILFKIKDTGSGMETKTKEFVDKILGITTTNEDKKEKSTLKYAGFGLLISKHLCHLMGGNIWFKTEKDIGTVFYFNIVCQAEDKIN